LLPSWGRGGRAALWRGFWGRSFSFYMLLTMPLVLMLALPLLVKERRAAYFATILTLLFVFFGIVLLRAVMDIFEISRKQLSEHRRNFQSTLGEDDFMHALGDRLRRDSRE